MRLRLLVVLLLGAGLMALGYQAPETKLKESEFRPLLLRPALARTISRPVLPMLIDVLWLRTLNAIGLRDTAQKNLALYEYGVALTEIDPRFYEVYKYVGLNVPFAAGRDTWVNAAEASDMFRRGLAAFPGDPPFHIYLGFNLFHRERKFLEASDVFLAASKLPNALDFFGPLAVRLRAHGGSPEEAIAITRQLIDAEADEAVKGMLEQRLGDLYVEVALQRVDRAAAAFKAQRGHDATSLQELRDAGLYDGPERDVLEGEIGVKDGKGTSTTLTRRFEIYE